MAEENQDKGEAMTVPKAKVRQETQLTPRLVPSVHRTSVGSASLAAIARTFLTLPLGQAVVGPAATSSHLAFRPLVADPLTTRVSIPDANINPPLLASRTAQFIEDVDAYMEGKEVEPTLNSLQTLFQQYKQIEQGLQQNRIRLGNKLPEIKRALDTVKLLCDKASTGEELDMHFELTDSVYAKAKVKDAESVYLWLGANVMLEYPLDEAKALLETNHANCVNNLATNRSDLAFVKDNITITEVSIARVYNWDVKKRKEEAAAKGGK